MPGKHPVHLMGFKYLTAAPWWTPRKGTKHTPEVNTASTFVGGCIAWNFTAVAKDVNYTCRTCHWFAFCARLRKHAKSWISDFTRELLIHRIVSFYNTQLAFNHNNYTAHYVRDACDEDNARIENRASRLDWANPWNKKGLYRHSQSYIRAWPEESHEGAQGGIRHGSHLFCPGHPGGRPNSVVYLDVHSQQNVRQIQARPARPDCMRSHERSHFEYRIWPCLQIPAAEELSGDASRESEHHACNHDAK